MHMLFTYFNGHISLPQSLWAGTRRACDQRGTQATCISPWPVMISALRTTYIQLPSIFAVALARNQALLRLHAIYSLT